MRRDHPFPFCLFFAWQEKTKNKNTTKEDTNLLQRLLDGFNSSFKRRVFLLHLSQAKANTTSQILETHTLAQTRKGRRKRKEGAGGGEDTRPPLMRRHTQTRSQSHSLGQGRETKARAAQWRQLGPASSANQTQSLSFSLSHTHKHTQAHTSTLRHKLLGNKKTKQPDRGDGKVGGCCDDSFSLLFRRSLPQQKNKKIIRQINRHRLIAEKWWKTWRKQRQAIALHHFPFCASLFRSVSQTLPQTLTLSLVLCRRCAVQCCLLLPPRCWWRL